MATTLRDFVGDLSIASAAQYVGESARAIAARLESRDLTPTQVRFLDKTSYMLAQWAEDAGNLYQGTYSPRLSLTLTALEAVGQTEEQDELGVGSDQWRKLQESLLALASVCRDLADALLPKEGLQSASEELLLMRRALLTESEAIGRRRLM